MGSDLPAPIAGKAKISRPLATLVANTLQRVYEHNRVPETWGTASVSRPTFDTLRREGFWATARYVTQRLQTTGWPWLSSNEKLTALLAGVTLVTLANTLLKREQRPEMMVRQIRRFSPHAPKFPVALYTLGATLLVAASGGGSGGGGGGGGDYDDDGGGGWSYPGSETSIDYRAYSRPDEEDGERGKPDLDDLDDIDI
ncbi:MAG: hypothetical protein JOZ71_04360 [Ktedonobacteraceae bacterium]|nr:hypothetical protein [Ktedonobacteraceae bacterium]